MPANNLWFGVSFALALLGAAEAKNAPPIGTSVAGLAWSGDRGEAHRLDDWHDRRLLAFIFLGAECPVSQLYAAPLAALDDRFKPRGVAFVGIGAQPSEASPDLAGFARANGIRFPILGDRGGQVAARLGATRIPEVVVLDRERVIRYRGRIDDQYAVGSRRAEVHRHDLAEALEELLEGRPVSQPETEPAGCPIVRPTRNPAKTDVVYSRDIAPILERRCVGCHRPGQVGPFSLTTYRQATTWAGAIAEAVEEGRMPPWHADPRYGRFANDAHLTAHEKSQILDWVDAGTPPGDPADLPRRVVYPREWRIPEPDLVISMPKPFTVPATGVLDYQYFEVDPGFSEDVWVRGTEIRPGNRKVVHHCNVFLKAPGSQGVLDAPGELGSYCLAATTPGSPPMILPQGMAKRIPAGWRLVFVVHYSPVGTVQEDRTSIGLLLADRTTVKKEVATNLLYAPDLRIPPHDPSFRVERTRRFEQDVLLLSMFPHMHVRGKSFRYEAVYPDGRAEILLDVPRYDFNWQNRYDLAEPKRLPAGTTLRCTAHYDNSRHNPANPDPSAVVLAGKQSWEEMFNGYYDIALADQDLTRPALARHTVWGYARKLANNGFKFTVLACAISLGFVRLNRRRFV